MFNQERPDAATIQQRLANTVNVNNTGPFGVPERTGLIFSGCRFNRNNDCGCGMVLDSLVRDVRFVNCSFDENVLYGLEMIAGTDNEGKFAVTGAAAYGVIVTACAFSGNVLGAIHIEVESSGTISASTFINDCLSSGQAQASEVFFRMASTFFEDPVRMDWTITSSVFTKVLNGKDAVQNNNAINAPGNPVAPPNTEGVPGHADATAANPDGAGGHDVFGNTYVNMALPAPG